MIISNELFCAMHINFIYIINIFIIYNRLFYIVNSPYFNLFKYSMIYARKCTYCEQMLKQKKIDYIYILLLVFFFFDISSIFHFKCQFFMVVNVNRQWQIVAMPISYLRIIIKLVNTEMSHLELGLVRKIKYENLIKHRQMIHLKRKNLENKTLINVIVLVKI